MAQIVKIMITEATFTQRCDDRLRALARDVRECGLSLYAIAQEARLSWQTVAKVANGIPVRFDTAERIKLVIELKGGGNA